jgi:calcineurin-like phosphoesterase family protein
MTVFVISDLHLGHKGILTFEHEGKPLRPFADLHTMHKVIARNWKAAVDPSDKVYVLGDVSFDKSTKKLLAGLPGRKRLVRGNHDHFSDNWYHEAGFQRIYGVRQIDRVWLTHVPMHPQSLEGRAIGNIHGHLHMNEVRYSPPGSQAVWPDSRYFNASVERINYTPISIDEIIHERMWTCKPRPSTT